MRCRARIRSGDCPPLQASSPNHGKLGKRGRLRVGRSLAVALPSVADYAQYDIELSDRDQIEVYEVCRWLAAAHRAHIVATEAERRVHVPLALPQILLLDEWNHPDVCNMDCLPSTSQTFVSIANALVAADGSRYQSTLPPNTHWRNWPNGGSL